MINKASTGNTKSNTWARESESTSTSESKNTSSSTDQDVSKSNKDHTSTTEEKRSSSGHVTTDKYIGKDNKNYLELDICMIFSYNKSKIIHHI